MIISTDVAYGYFIAVKHLLNMEFIQLHPHGKKTWILSRYIRTVKKKILSRYIRTVKNMEFIPLHPHGKKKQGVYPVTSAQ